MARRKVTFVTLSRNYQRMLDGCAAMRAELREEGAALERLEMSLQALAAELRAQAESQRAREALLRGRQRSGGVSEN
jgi:DNA repair ATPase RecN